MCLLGFCVPSLLPAANAHTLPPSPNPIIYMELERNREGGLPPSHLPLIVSSCRATFEEKEREDVD